MTASNALIGSKADLKQLTFDFRSAVAGSTGRRKTCIQRRPAVLMDISSEIIHALLPVYLVAPNRRQVRLDNQARQDWEQDRPAADKENKL
jgi:hypothetical protein